MVCARLTKMFITVKVNIVTGASGLWDAKVWARSRSWSAFDRWSWWGAERGHTGKVCKKDIHQHREESSRARGMLASRAKSESLAYRRGRGRTAAHEEEWERCGGEGGGDRVSYPKAARPAKHRTSPQQEKKRRNKQAKSERDWVTNQQLLLVLVLLRWTLEGYEPDDAGVKHSQNYFCNENRAVVLALYFGPTTSRESIKMWISFRTWKQKRVRSTHPGNPKDAFDAGKDEVEDAEAHHSVHHCPQSRPKTAPRR